MPENLLIPSVDLRIGGLEEYNRRQHLNATSKSQKKKPRPVITLSREFGCEGYPVAEKLCDLVSERTGDKWILIDNAILEEVARNHNISEDILHHLGENNRILDEVMATFSTHWKTDRDHFQLLCSYIISLAEQGNVIIVELGGSTIARHIEHSYHFRIYASETFKMDSLSRRLSLPAEEAADLMHRMQKKRNRFNLDFLNLNGHDPALYDLMFNNDRCTPEKIVRTIANYAAP
jgi:cytidylate kinase